MEQKGITCKIPLELHQKITEEIKAKGITMGIFIAQIIEEHYTDNNGGNKTMENTRTLAFQVSEELFQAVKKYLADYEKAYHRKLTQKEFVIGLIEDEIERFKTEFPELANAAPQTPADTTPVIEPQDAPDEDEAEADSIEDAPEADYPEDADDEEAKKFARQ